MRPFIRSTIISTLVFVGFAGCVHGPPDVAPSARLSPDGAGAGGQTSVPFAVSFAGPRGEVAVRNDMAVTVVFNHALRTPETPDDAGLPAFRVETNEGRAVLGALRWVGTRGLIFFPDVPLPGATRFVATLPAGVKSLDGQSFARSYRFEFFTTPPRLLGSQPTDGSKEFLPTDSFTLVFDQGVEPSAIERSGTLKVAGKAASFHVSRPPVLPPARGSKNDGPGEHPLEHTVRVTPGVRIPVDTPLSFTIAGDLRGAEGPAPMGHEAVVGFRTYGPLELVDIRCPRVNLGQCQANRDVALVLSNKVTPAQLRAHLRADIPRAVRGPDVAPKGHPMKGASRAKDAPHEASTLQTLGVNPRAGKRYRVTLTAGLEDVFGQRLATDISVDVDIEQPFGKPAANAPDAPDALDAPDAKPASAPLSPPGLVPSRPVLTYEARIGVTGDLLEAVGSKTPKVPVGVVNLPTYGMVTGALQEQEVLRWLTKADRSSGPGGKPWHWKWTTPSSPHNTRSVDWLDVDSVLASSRGSHAAFIALAVPGANERPASTEFLNVTDLAVSAKASRFGTLVWVTHLSTGSPVGGATVALRNAKSEIFSTETDVQGVATIPSSAFSPIMKGGAIDRSTLLFVRAKGDWLYQRLERSAADRRAAPGVDLAQKGSWEGFVFTDRGIYKPGETVKMSALVRRSDAAGLRVPPATEVRIDVKDAQDDPVFSGYAMTNAFGELSLDFPLPHTSHLGPAVITVEVDRNRQNAFSTTVTLATYRPTEFRVDVQPGAPEYVRGDTATFAAAGEYLYGAPMSGASVDRTASRSRTTFVPKGSLGFTTTDDSFAADTQETNPASQSLQVDSGALDSAGHATSAVHLDMVGQTGPEVVVFEAEVHDLTQQTVAGTTSVIVHPAPFYVGLRGPESRFLAVGATVKPQVVAFNPDGTHRVGVPVRVELITRSWTEVAVDEASDSPRRVSKRVDTVMGACDAVTGAAITSCPIRLPSAGYFILRATSAGPVVHASTFLYGVDDRPDAPPPVGWHDDGSRHLVLESDKETYTAGETARVLVRNPFKEADALVTVERAGVLWHQVVHVRGPMPIVSVPIVSAYFPNAFIAVHLVRGRVAPKPEPQEADLGGPEFRTGYKEVAIDQESHRLNVGIHPSKSEYRPGEEVDADVDVTDHGGRATAASVTFYAVDEGVLMLTGYVTPDPLPSLAQRKTLADFGVESRERLARILPMKDGEAVRILGFEYPNAPAPDAEDKGGPGGGGGDANAIRAEFRSTAYFEPSRATNGEGRAHFRFKLPDNLTRFRLMAVVATADDRFGRGETTFTSSRKLMARPAVPRVVRVGDTFQASVVVSSKELTAADVTVALDAKGIEVDGPRSRHVTLPRSGQVEISFPVRAIHPGSAELAFAVSGGGSNDRVLVRLRVDLPVDERTAAVYGEMTRDSAIALGDLSHVLGDRGSLTIRLASSALVGIEPAFEQLSEYPYGCTEQLTSRLLPLLALDDLATAFHVRVPANTRDVVDTAVGDILSHQQGDGGFGYWSDDSTVPWLSAYAMWALETASKKGYYLPAGALDRGTRYLRSHLTRATGQAAPDSDSEFEADESQQNPTEVEDDPYDTSGALISDVLAMLGAADPGYIDRAYEARGKASLSSQALLLHAMASAHVQPTALQTLAHEIEQRLRLTTTEAVAADEGDPRVLDSPARTTALVLRALLAVAPHHALAPRLARGLLGQRQHGAWRSTQENLWALVALEEYRKAQESHPADVDVEAYLGGDSIGVFALHDGTGSKPPIVLPMARLTQAPGANLAFAMKGQGRAFYSAELTYAVRELPRVPEDHGFFVQRFVRALKPTELDKALDALPKKTALRAEVGDLVLVDLLVESSEPRENVVLDDPLPAGVEALQVDLKTTSSRVESVGLGGRERLSKRPAAAGRYGGAFVEPSEAHREIHTDRVLTFARHLDPGMVHFRYLARATTIGHFVTPPAEIRCMYAPEVSGRTATTTFDVVAPARVVAMR